MKEILLVAFSFALTCGSTFGNKLNANFHHEIDFLSVVSGCCVKGFQYDVKAGKCYQHNSALFTFGEALAACKKSDAKLAEPKNSAENAAIAKLSKEPLWIGVVRDFARLPDNVFVYASTNQPIAYWNWQETEPNNRRLNENAVVTNWVRYIKVELYLKVYLHAF